MELEIQSMKLTILQSQLKEALSKVARAVATKSTLPVLTNVLLEATPKTLTIKATNLEIAVEAAAAATVEICGVITVPARTFIDLVDTLPDEAVDLELNGDVLNVKCGRFTNNVRTMSASEFPDIGSQAFDEVVELSPDELREALSVVTFAAATDDSRPILAGVHFVVGESSFEAEVEVTFEAADGFRLSQKAVVANDVNNGGYDTIVPSSALKELSRVIDDSNSVYIGLSENKSQLRFDSGNVVFYSQLIDGNFVATSDIIPKSYSHQVMVGKRDLLAAVKVARVFSRESADILRLKIGDNQLTVSAIAVETGDSETVLDAVTEGASLEFALNTKYLLAWLSVATGDKVTLETVSPTDPVRLRCDDLDFVHVIMPMHLPE